MQAIVSEITALCAKHELKLSVVAVSGTSPSVRPTARMCVVVIDEEGYAACTEGKCEYPEPYFVRLLVLVGDPSRFYAAQDLKAPSAPYFHITQGGAFATEDLLAALKTATRPVFAL